MGTSGWTQRYGTTALVTGASSGIGEQFARELAARGFNLVLTARRAELLQTLKEKLELEQGISVTCITCDLSDTVQVDQLIAQVLPLDIGLAISNAGYGVLKGAYVSVEIDALEAMYRANSLAPARIAHALLPVMMAKKRGGFIFTGSIEGDAVFPLSAAYAASKAFLHSLVQALWYEVKDSGVDVLLLAPGATDTEAPVKQGISRDQLQGVMSPADVAQQALAHLGLQPHFTPGFRNRLLIGLLRCLPRKLAIAMAGYGVRRALDDSGAA
jgi:short-subunit dehydrogenase